MGLPTGRVPSTESLRVLGVRPVVPKMIRTGTCGEKRQPSTISAYVFSVTRQLDTTKKSILVLVMRLVGEGG